MLISAQFTEAFWRRIKFLSRVTRLSLIWQLALARGEMVSLTWLMAARRSSLARVLLPFVWEASCMGDMSILLEGMRVRDEERDCGSRDAFFRGVLVLMLAGVADGLSGESSTNVPSRLVLWLQSWSTRNDLK
jgi:hypothetical protein